MTVLKPYENNSESRICNAATAFIKIGTFVLVVTRSFASTLLMQLPLFFGISILQNTFILVSIEY